MEKNKTKKELNQEIEKYKSCIDFYFGDEYRNMDIEELFNNLKRQKNLNNKLRCVCCVLSTGLLCISFYLIGLMYR